MDILQQQNPRNCLNQQDTMESYKLGQETKITSHKSYQIQWLALQ